MGLFENKKLSDKWRAVYTQAVESMRAYCIEQGLEDRWGRLPSGGEVYTGKELGLHKEGEEKDSAWWVLDTDERRLKKDWSDFRNEIDDFCTEHGMYNPVKDARQDSAGTAVTINGVIAGAILSCFPPTSAAGAALIAGSVAVGGALKAADSEDAGVDAVVAGVTGAAAGYAGSQGSEAGIQTAVANVGTALGSGGKTLDSNALEGFDFEAMTRFGKNLGEGDRAGMVNTMNELVKLGTEVVTTVMDLVGTSGTISLGGELATMVSEEVQAWRDGESIPSDGALATILTERAKGRPVKYETEGVQVLTSLIASLKG